MIEPIEVSLEEGKSYFWCACGKSETQPWCDGSHSGSGITPVRYECNTSEKRYICACKHTLNPPFCDGSHNDTN